MHVPRPLAALIVVILALGLLVGCSSSPTATTARETATTAAATGSDTTGTAKAATPELIEAGKVYAQYDGMTGEKRRAALTAAAEKEGELVIYTSMTSDIVDGVVQVFEDTFDLSVSVYRAGSETVLQRVIQESSANFQGNDVLETNAGEMIAANEQAVLAPYTGEARDKVIPAGLFDGWTATRINLFVPSWNTDLVKPGEEPKSWEELTDPKWKGKISMELSDSDWMLALWDYWAGTGKSDADIETLFRKMAANAKVVKGHTVQSELLGAGQFAVVVSNYSYITAKAAKKGAPVAFKPMVSPAFARPNGIGLMKNAAHPAAALLFTDWLLTEGQQVIADAGLTPSTISGDPSMAGVEVLPVPIEKLMAESDKWNALYEDILKNSEKAGK